MPKNNFYIWFGIWIAVTPFLGVPSLWKIYLACASGIFLSLYAAWPAIFKKLQTKPKVVRKKVNKAGSELRFDTTADNNLPIEDKVSGSDAEVL